MGNNKQYWRGIEELEQTPQFIDTLGKEFSDKLPMEEALSGTDQLSSNRRDFLKYFGFSVSAVALAACNKSPVKHVIPYLEKPENVTPGVPLYYATSCGVYNEGFPVIAKVREGRPIKLDGNDKSFLSQGGLDAIGQASILSLYDVNRLGSPLVDGVDTRWSDVDSAVVSKLKNVVSAGKKIAVVTPSATGPVLQEAVNNFIGAYNGAVQVTYDPVSYSGILDANNESFGKRVIPNYRFDKAHVIVSFGADFLGTWLSPVRFQADYAKNRVPTGDNRNMSLHIQVESLLSVTGTNADHRFTMQESQEGIYLLSLYNALAGHANVSPLQSKGDKELPGNGIKLIAKELWAAKGKSLVISKSNNKDHQVLVNHINMMLGNYGTSIDLTTPYLAGNYSETAFEALVDEMANGSVGGVVFVNTNPLYSYHNETKLSEALDKASVVISTSIVQDETSSKATIHAPDNHWLESWDIKEPVKGHLLFSQPVMSQVFNTRQVIESLNIWAGKSVPAEDGAYNLVNEYFSTHYPGDWKQAIHDGVLTVNATEDVEELLSLNSTVNVGAIERSAEKSGDLELILYQKVGPRDGTWAVNPWCHEMPDPVTKVTYDNYVTISMPDSEKLGIKNGDFVKISSKNASIDKIPALVQPGQVRGTLGLAIGYGRNVNQKADNDLRDLGHNAYPFVEVRNGNNSMVIASGIQIEKAGGNYEFALTQTHHTIEGRDHLREATLEEYKANPKVRNEHSHHLISLWNEHDLSTGHHWGMAIDMNACTGCGSCIVSCSIENNVPVVGRDEVRRRREMHWIRIDRYYSFGVSNGQSITKQKEIDAASADLHEDVDVVHQPVMCQHCDHAPCETVCPVLATTHSSEGLNQMTYNRCIGTKYCGNNCPYKVRRFNWFRYNMNHKYDYHFNNELGRMVLNPDVTVRSRGVMEKCSFCVQNIQSAKLTAKREIRKLADGEAQTACARACPSNAIVFGDMNDPDSRISVLKKNERSYHMLEEVNTAPSVVYMTKIRNKK